MVGGIVMALLAMRAGVEVRRARARGFGRISDLRRAHVRLAKFAVPVVVLGFVGGPVSMFFLRSREPFGTLHAVLGLTVATLFIATAVWGRQVEQGRLDAAALHGRLALAAVVGAGAAAITGMVLLP
ncbi:MAG: DUF4079 family protein [Deltaproteobacteria bacterium]|nr:DUF4079 family protein [Deltaproteobacteria bacterium]MBW2445476.1 DUF4079 family protein [Deltaproteobacteria bacterium]